MATRKRPKGSKPERAPREDPLELPSAESAESDHGLAREGPRMARLAGLAEGFNLGPGRMMEMSPGQDVEFIPAQPTVGDIVLYTRSGETWPAIIVRTHGETDADLVVWHEAKRGHCTSFIARCPRTPAAQLTGDAGGWDLRCVAAQAVSVPAPAGPADADE